MLHPLQIWAARRWLKMRGGSLRGSAAPGSALPDIPSLPLRAPKYAHQPSITERSGVMAVKISTRDFMVAGAVPKVNGRLPQSVTCRAFSCPLSPRLLSQKFGKSALNEGSRQCLVSAPTLECETYYEQAIAEQLAWMLLADIFPGQSTMLVSKNCDKTFRSPTKVVQRLAQICCARANQHMNSRFLRQCTGINPGLLLHC